MQRRRAVSGGDRPAYEAPAEAIRGLMGSPGLIGLDSCLLAFFAEANSAYGIEAHHLASSVFRRQAKEGSFKFGSQSDMPPSVSLRLKTAPTTHITWSLVPKTPKV